MRTLLAAFLICASLCTTSFGQALSLSTPTAVVGLGQSAQVGDLILVPEDTKLTMQPIGLIQVNTEAANVVVKVSDINRASVPLTKVDSTTYYVTQSGKLWVRVICIDFPKNIYQEEEEIFTVGTAPTPPPGPDPGPGPTPPPTPDVPPDQFDNIGQRVAEWTKGLKINLELSQLYLKYELQLRTNPNTTPNETAAALLSEVSMLPGYVEYVNFSKGLNADFSKRWAQAPMSKGVMADYYHCVAVGLGAR